MVIVMTPLFWCCVKIEFVHQPRNIAPRSSVFKARGAATDSDVFPFEAHN